MKILTIVFNVPQVPIKITKAETLPLSFSFTVRLKITIPLQTKEAVALPESLQTLQAIEVQRQTREEAGTR